METGSSRGVGLSDPVGCDVGGRGPVGSGSDQSDKRRREVDIT